MTDPNTPATKKDVDQLFTLVAICFGLVLFFILLSDFQMRNIIDRLQPSTMPSGK